MTDLERRFQAHPQVEPVPDWYDARLGVFLVALLVVLLLLAIVGPELVS